MAKVSNVQLGPGADAPETPTQKATAVNARQSSTTDSLGRIIEMVRPSPLDVYRLMKLLGPQVSANAPAVQMMLLAASVVRIGDNKIPPPSSEREIEAILQQLEFEGLVAVQALADKAGELNKEALDLAKN